MSNIKTFTDINQSKKLAEILPLESADMSWYKETEMFPFELHTLPYSKHFVRNDGGDKLLPCWSLAALLDYIKNKCGYFELVYLKSTIDGRANRLENVHRLSTDVYDIYEKEAIDACYEMILKLHELNIL